MADARDLPETFRRIVGPLPNPGVLDTADAYPFQTISPVKDGFVERDGVRTYFALWGERGPVIAYAPIYQIVHMQALKTTVPYLSRHFRVITVDLRGNGRSDRPSDPALYSFDQYYADMVAVLDRLDVERLAVIGISLTSMTALRLAAEQPERVSHLIVAGGMPESLVTDAVKPFVEASHNQMVGDWPVYLEDFFRRCFTEPHSTKPFEDGVRYAWSTTGKMLSAGLRGWQHTDVRPLAKKVRAPTLVIHGDADRRISYAQGKAVHEIIPHAELLTIRGGGHLTAVRDPVIWNHAVRDFVGVAPVRNRTWTRGMARPKKALFVSSPIGLGHAQRDLAIARELRKLEPGIEISWFTVDPAARYLTQEGETVHPITERLANESRHFEHVAGEHDLSAFYALRTMDEIMVNNFMTFSDLVEAEDFDLVIGDEAWDVDYYYHENPELKRQPFVFLTDFVGCLPTEGDERECHLCADRNADDIEHVARYPYIRDEAIFIGNPEDVVEDPFGPDLPKIREWTDANFRYSGYTLPFDPAAFADIDALRARLGYRPEEKLVIAAVGGTSVGGHLLRKIASAFPAMKKQVPELRMILVTGPRLSGATFPELPGLETRAYVHNLFEHLACCDLALVQGGLSTCMELVATRRPFLNFPLQRHFEQRIHVQRRLKNYGADCALDYATLTTASLASRALETLHRPVGYRRVETGGAARAAEMIARVLERRGRR